MKLLGMCALRAGLLCALLPLAWGTESTACSADGLRVVQLLSGRDHSLGDRRAAQMQNFQYLIGDSASNRVMVVDGAWDPKGIAQAAERAGLEIVSYLATHYHWDHVGALRGRGSPPAAHTVPGLAAFVDEYRVPAYVHRVEREQVLAATGVRDGGRVIGVENGTEMQMDRVKLTVLHTPGHSPGGISVLLATGGRVHAVITGDTLFPGSCGRLDLPGSSARQMFDSLQHVLAGLPDHLVVWPGHAYGPNSSTIGEERRRGLLQPMSLQRWSRMMGG